MSFDGTIKELRSLLAQATQDLEKATLGNKAAAQRVRTGTVKLEKVAKAYRKESIHNEKTGASHHGKAKSKSAAKPASRSKASVATKSAHAKVIKKSSPASKAKAPAKAVVAKSHSLNLKKPTAKLPARKPRSW